MDVIIVCINRTEYHGFRRLLVACAVPNHYVNLIMLMLNYHPGLSLMHVRARCFVFGKAKCGCFPTPTKMPIDAHVELYTYIYIYIYIYVCVCVCACIYEHVWIKDADYFCQNMHLKSRLQKGGHFILAPECWTYLLSIPRRRYLDWKRWTNMTPFLWPNQLHYQLAIVIFLGMYSVLFQRHRRIMSGNNGRIEVMVVAVCIW